jgi:hypothetical protein
MLNLNITIHNEGAVVGISHIDGKAWAEYYLTGKYYKKVENVLLYILNHCEPIRGDKGTLKDYEKFRKGRTK